jgi:menaquinol-cytochrome c reductase iron-sulfur subunit
MLIKDQTRRTFYISFVNLLGGLMAAAMAVPAALYLAIKPKSAEDSDWVEVTDVAQLKVNTPTEVLYDRNRVDGWRKVMEKSSAWVVRTEDHNVIAYKPACTHLACAYHWENKANKFVCPCHGSEFSIEGKVLAGPAPRPLDRFLTKVEGSKVMLGTQVEKG